MKWRAFFHENEPNEAELNDTILPEHPPGYESWSAWAALRNTALSLLRHAGFSTIAARLRYNSGHPQAALELLFPSL